MLDVGRSKGRANAPAAKGARRIPCEGPRLGTRAVAVLGRFGFATEPLLARPSESAARDGSARAHRTRRFFCILPQPSDRGNTGGRTLNPSAAPLSNQTWRAEGFNEPHRAEPAPPPRGRDGARKPPANALDCESMPLPAELLRLIAAALEPLGSVRVAWLFGSHVRGTATERSDLDLAVALAIGLDDVARERTRRRIIAALTDALGRLGERTDVVDVDRAASGVAFRALREGQRVLSRSESDRVGAEVRIMRRYHDEAPRRALYREAARTHAGGAGGRP